MFSAKIYNYNHAINFCSALDTFQRTAAAVELSPNLRKVEQVWLAKILKTACFIVRPEIALTVGTLFHNSVPSFSRHYATSRRFVDTSFYLQAPLAQ